MPRIISSSLLAACLIEEGLVPKECSDIDLEMPADGVTRLIYRVFVEDVDLAKLGRAFSKAGRGEWPERTSTQRCDGNHSMPRCDDPECWQC